MAKVVDKRYPEFGAYKGKAVEGKLICVTLPFVDITSNIVDTIETEVANDGATMLSLEVWAWNQQIPTAPYYVRYWYVIMRAYGGTITYGSVKLVPPAWVGWVAIIAALVALGVIIYFIVKEIKEILHVVGEEPLALLALIVGIGGLSFVSYLAYKTLQERRVAIPA